MALFNTNISGGSAASVEKIISGATASQAAITIDISSLVTDYANCTIDNFIVVPTRFETASASGSKECAVPTYDATTGQISVNYGSGIFYMTRYDVYYLPNSYTT